ncbi:MAG: hypothetical protein KF709_12920 [Gemmatimonadaceae bacterium]|nr:hypothetical protein [Gemmatimonadaceae bacterium]
MLPRLAGLLDRHALLLAVVGIAGCADPLSPRDVAGVYALRTIPPSVMDGGDVLRLLADTLVLHADGTGERRSSLERTLADSPVPVIEVLFSDLTYRLKGRFVGVEPVPGPCEACAGGPLPPLRFEFLGRALRFRSLPGLMFDRVADAPAP